MMIKLSVIILSLFLMNCALKQKPNQELPPMDEQAAEQPAEGATEPLLKYSDMNNMAPPTDRNYKRMTRQKMEEEADLQETAGSLWLMDGQTSYLFSQNKHRNEGDLTSIKVEGTALKLIENKVAVIQDLLGVLEEQRIKADEENKVIEAEKQRLAEEEKRIQDQELAKKDPNYDPFAGQYPADLADPKKRQPASEKKPASTAKAKAKAKDGVVDLKEVSIIPSRIVEKTKDGLYRVRGQQFLTIMKKPYKVIATGLIRPEDFDDNGISSSKMRDPQFDVIHIKRTE